MSIRPLLSAAIIVKDEADFLRSCLTSIRDVCDEIVVVDTGSTDDSVAVAEEFGAVVRHRPWDDDFAAARNFALDTATGEWILYIDADEQVEEMDIRAAREELRASTNAVSILVKFRSRPMFSPYREYRLWRHRPDIRFFGRIHETMVPDIHKVADSEGMVIIESAHFSLCHYGYEGDQTRKHHRNLPLLERRVVEYPDRCYLWNHLAQIREALGDFEGARAAWGAGLDLIRTRGLKDTTDVLVYAGFGRHMLDRGEDITEFAEEALREAPWFHSARWLAAVNHQRLDRHREAAALFRELIDVGYDPVSPTIAYHNDMFTVAAWSGLAASLYALGDHEGALEMYERVLEDQPEHLEARTKAAVLRSLLGRR